MESTSSLIGRTAGAITSRCATAATPRSGRPAGTRRHRTVSTLSSPGTGWHDYIDQLDPRILNLCPECAVRALRRGEIRTLADWRIRPRTLLHARRPGGLRPTDRPRTDGGEPAADRRLTKTEHLAAPAQTQTPRNGHNAGNGWTGSFPSPCFLLSATENPSVGSIPTSGTP